MTKKYFFVLLFLLVGLNVFSQNLKYKDIFQIVKSGDYVVAYNLLFEYQKNNPQFANTYFQLGLISYYNILEADPLLEYDKIEYFHYNVHLFWELAKKFIIEDNSEVTKNRKYYQNVPELANIKRLSAPDVIDFINKRLRQSDDLVEEMRKIHDQFYAMVQNYTLCVDYFRKIVAQYSKLKDLYLVPRRDIFPKLDSLQRYFDLSINKYQEYKALITSYPLEKYNQTIKFEPIQLYRLDGITNTDFLNNKIIFWNYGQWIKQIKNIINTDIKQLRNTIEQEFNNLSQKEKELLSAKKYSDDYSGYYLLSKVIFQIEKYDLNSLISAILKYKTAKTDFLAFRLHKFNDKNDSTVKFIVRANNYYQEQIIVRRLDSLLELINKLATPQNIYKHKDFVERHFPHGIPPYINQEREQLRNLLSEDLQNYKYFLYRDVLEYPFVKQTIEYNNEPIYLYPVVDTVSTAYITMDVSKDKLGNIFVAGVKRNRNKLIPFVIKITADIVQWERSVPIKNVKRINSVKQFSYTDGVVAVFNYIDAENKARNYVVFYNQLGKIKYKSISPQVPYNPIFLHFDDINNVLILAYKGHANTRFDRFANDTLILQKWNMDSAYLHWQKDFILKGNFTNIIRFDTIYYAFVNFNELNALDSKQEIHSDISAVGAIKISAKGEILSLNKVVEKNFYLVYAYKLSSKKINLLGFETKPFDSNSMDYDQLPALKSFIINKF